MDKQTTPAGITPQIVEFCKTVDATQTPLFVDLIDVPGMNHSDCYVNVAKHIKNHGGKIQHGWTIWEEPNVIIEAEFHAVWVDDAGRFLDVTPKAAGEKRILFLPDSTKVYNSCPVNNIRLILTKNPKEIAAIKLNEELCNLRIKYNVDGIDADIPQWERKRLEPLIKASLGLLSPPNPNRRKIGKDEACPCGSRKKYRHCCMSKSL